MKKLLALLLAAMMIFALAACQGNTPASEAPASEAPAAPASAAPASEAPAPAPADNGPIKVGFAQVGHESDWRTASTKSAQDVFSAANGYELSFVDADQDSAKQIEAVRTFIQNEVDYIIIDPIVSTGWDTILTEAQDANIPVIIIDRTVDDSDKYVCWVGSNFLTEGLAAGEWLKAYAAAKGITEINALVIEGSKGSSAQIGRTDGFKQIADAEGWTILDSQDGNFTEAGGQEIMESYCKSYAGKFNVVVCQNDNEGFGAITAMKNAGVSFGVGGDVILISFDACTAGLEKVKSGEFTVDFECNPLAAPTVEEVIKTLEAGGTPEKTVYMPEHWYVNDESNIPFSINGEDQSSLIVLVNDDVIAAQY